MPKYKHHHETGKKRKNVRRARLERKRREKYEYFKNLREKSSVEQLEPKIPNS